MPPASPAQRRPSTYESLRADPPAPNPGFVGALAVRAFEAIQGTRPISQLGNAITWDLAVRLGQVRAARTERRSLFRDERHSAARPGRVFLCRPAEGVAEASVVLHTKERTHAVAIRLEWVHAHWRATDLTVL